jgi:hypothetical protein
MEWDETLFAPLPLPPPPPPPPPATSQVFGTSASTHPDPYQDQDKNHVPPNQVQDQARIAGQEPTPGAKPSGWAPLTGFWDRRRLTPTEFWFALFGFFLFAIGMAALLYLLLAGSDRLVPFAPTPTTSFTPPDWLSNPLACGPSALSCDVTGGQICSSGACVCGTPGFQYCPSVGCVSLLTTQRCGACDISCLPGQTCEWDEAQGRARCVCPTGTRLCNGTCVSETDPSHCGQCFFSCGASFACAMTLVTLPDGTTTTAPGCVFQGSPTACGPSLQDCTTFGAYGACVYDTGLNHSTCVNLLTNPSHCGVQGFACAPGEACVGGTCLPADTVDSCGPSAANCFLALPGAFAPRCCSGGCVDIATNLTYCGGCARTAPCTGANATCIVNPIYTYVEAGITAPMPYRCSSPDNDRFNCGTLGLNCANIFGDGGLCLSGSCINTLDSVTYCATFYGATPVACAANQRCCGGSCVDVQTNASNCAACGVRCPTGSSCIAAACVISSAVAGGQCGTLVCGPTEYCCADGCKAIFGNDPSNCGGCGLPCSGTGLTCVTGVCYSTLTDANNCGTIGNACGAGEQCCSGVCINTTTNVTYCGSCIPLAPAVTANRHCCGGTLYDNTNPTSCGTQGCGLNCNPGPGPHPNPRSCCIVGTNAYCVDFATSTTNCGACGVVCPPGFLCCGGTCKSPTSIDSCGSCNQKCNGGITFGAGMKAACLQNGAAVPFCANLAADPLNCNAQGVACAATQICVPTLVLGVTAGTCVARFTSATTLTITAVLNPVTFFVGLQALLAAAVSPGQIRMPNGLGIDPLIAPFACGGYNVWCREASPQCVNGFCRCSTNAALARCAPGFVCSSDGFGGSNCQPQAYLCSGQTLCPDPYAASGDGYTCAAIVANTSVVPNVLFPGSVSHCGQCGLRCAAGQTCTLKRTAAGTAATARPACTCTTHTQCPPGHYCMQAHPSDPNTSSSCQPLP